MALRTRPIGLGSEGAVKRAMVADAPVQTSNHVGDARRPADPGGVVVDRADRAADLFAGDGAMAALMRAADWAKTPIGPVETWSLSLRMMVSFLLANRFPLLLWWGPQYASIYNDAYCPVLGLKHPQSLGRPCREVWTEIWDVLQPLIDTPFNGGPSTWMEDLALEVNRHGFMEETHFTVAYSPVPDELAPRGIGGVLATVHEITANVVNERRVAALRDLGAHGIQAKTAEEACAIAAATLAKYREDVPFALLYLIDQDGKHARLAGSAGVETGAAAGPPVLDLAAGAAEPAAWPVAEVVRTDQAVVVEDLADRFAEVPPGPWSDPPNCAVIVPIRSNTPHQLAGVLVGGISSRLRLDGLYHSFLDLMAGQIATAVANARAYEEERRRAEALAAIDRAKTVFFSNVSHEFRTPLTLMLGPIEDALSDPGEALGPRQRERIAMVQRNGWRLQKLVNMLLDFSRVEAGRMQAVYEPSDLGTLTRDLASSFRSACERAGISLTIETRALPEPVFVDRGMWEKIVLNLISNAFKYTFDGGIAVSLDAEDAGAVLRVSDTGIGIPASELPLIFERFHRVENARGRTHEGTGIGLALVQELVKLHGGSIEVASTVGRGATFTVRVPFGSAHLPSEQVASERTQASTATGSGIFVGEALRWLPESADGIDEPPPSPPPATERRRILLADDNADMREYLTRLLAPYYDVIAVADGEQALAAATREHPDLVLTDVMMPRLDGFGLLHRLRLDPRLRDIPVLVLSARAGEEAKVEGLQAGADDYLVKPFSARELLARVESNIEQATNRLSAADALRGEAHRLQILNRTATVLVAEPQLERLVQAVTDAATELTGAEFGAFFYNIIDANGESYRLYTLSGASREDFAGFPQPRNTAVFAPTFNGEGIVRSGDIRKDPRYGKSAPYYGVPKGHIPVVSYLSAPVIGPTGEVLGGLFFAHPEPDRFTEHHELIVAGIASQAAVAFEKARLYEASRQAEADLRRLNETLEERVAAEVGERMKAEEALRQAQKMEAIGQLTGGVAHDFNNLLQVVLGHLDGLKRQLDGPAAPSPAEIGYSIDAAARGAERAASLTQRLLAFSRRQPLDPRPVDVNRLVSGMSELLRRTLGESIGIETRFADGLWQVSADPNQLESAILNLAVNARDAMPEGGKLTIETANAAFDGAHAAIHPESRPGEYVMIAISDSGLGMTEEVVAAAFDPFFTTKEPGQGTGLGLSQVYGFVKQSNGHVELDSKPGRGTTVRIHLPRLRSEPAVEEKPRAAAVPAADASETILLVEDDEAVRELSTSMLRQLGYIVIEAGDGATALQQLRTDPGVRLLFTDVGLPGKLNGRQLAERAVGSRPDLKVLFTTGYGRDAIVHDGRLDPGIELLPKPFTMAALATKIRELLDRG